ncbi:methyl-accepting chemotaxis protein [Chitinimonas viridis]|uniref:Methyl-accepting chemotaxis protein n=1 Tax=Chitinimonas viridis TaxID=664880 RepID=A0ABT8B861_9NEIS|nr:methyl-accepting chemotaxis protein [Chitinimonas viridis]MDN3577801.1 methyl-accepting chemotaxis protein [Chitinimonas viridis]
MSRSVRQTTGVVLMKLSYRMSAVIGAVCSLLVVIGVIAVVGFQNNQAGLVRFVERDQAELQTLTRLYVLAQGSSVSLRSLYADPTNEQALAELNAAPERIAAVVASANTLLAGDADDLKRLARFAELRKLQQQYQFEARELVLGGDLDAARDKIIQFESMLAWEPMQALLEDWLKATHGQVQAAKAEAAAASQRIIGVVVGVALGALVLAVLLGVWLVRSVMRQIGGEPDMARTVMRRLAEGDLAQAVAVRAGDSDSLLASVEAMRQGLAGNVQALRALAEQVSSEASQVSGGTRRISGSARQQSDSAAAMAAAIEQLSVSVNHLADNARVAHSLTEQAGQGAETGSVTIQKVGAEIDRVAKSIAQSAGTINALGAETERISSIVAVIRDIADQTNLLALNAAIEAARAGDTGRGFAVVADEVRKLAERTSQATAQIGGMIAATQASAVEAVRDMEAAVGQVAVGVSGARSADAAMRAIQAGSHELVGVTNEISLALKEQSSASQEIAQNVERIVQMAASTTDEAEQGAAAAGRLAEVAQALQASVAHFRL